MASSPMLLPELGLHLGAPFVLLLIWAALRRRTSSGGRVLDTTFTAAVAASYLWVVGAVFSRGIDWRLARYEVERPFDARIGSWFSSAVVLAFWLLLSTPLILHGIRSRREGASSEGWLTMPLQCPRPFWRLVRRVMHSLALSTLSWFLLVYPFDYSRIPKAAHLFLYRVLDGPISAVNWLLPDSLQTGYASQFFPTLHGDGDPARYVVIGTATWAVLIRMFELLLSYGARIRGSWNCQVARTSSARSMSNR